MDIEQYKQIKRRAEEAKAAAGKAEGALDQLLGDLHDEFQCNTREAAEALLTQLEDEEQQAQQLFDRALAKFEEDYGPLLPNEG